MPKDIIENNAFREFPHIPSHLRTFNAWLFKKIKLEDMLYYGDFFPMTWDYVMMLPMIEMAGERHVCIHDTIMYTYNNSNILNDHRISRQLQAYLAQLVRSKKRYSRLNSSDENFAYNLSDEKVDILIFSEKQRPDLLEEIIVNIQEKLSGVGTIAVLFWPSSSTEDSYKMIQKKYSSILFFEITEYRENFRDLLKKTYQAFPNNYILFMQDSTHIIEPIDLTFCIQKLEETQAYTFSLKLSKEKPYKPYPTRLPLLELGHDLYAWYFAVANDCWACANSVDMQLYRKNKTIEKVFDEGYMYPSSTGFQELWANEGNLERVGLCFNYPKTCPSNQAFANI